MVSRQAILVQLGLSRNRSKKGKKKGAVEYSTAPFFYPNFSISYLA